jgi:GNAT superfamily N-acetyltransferase
MLLFVVRRCDGFYRFWHDVTTAAPIEQAHVAFDQLTGGGTHSTTPDDAEYYDIFAVAPLPAWKNGPVPLIRRLHRYDSAAIEAHLFRLNTNDRRLRFFREITDEQISGYVRTIDWATLLILGAICADRVVGIAEVLYDRSGCHAEVAVSVDRELRGHGLGRHLVDEAVQRATMLGMRQANFSFLRENRPMQRIIRALGGMVDMEDLIGMLWTGDDRLAAARYYPPIAA